MPRSQVRGIFLPASPDRIPCREEVAHIRTDEAIERTGMSRTAPAPVMNHTAQSAKTMSDVRQEIDRLDRQLVTLLVERQSFMDAAARIKGHRGAVLDRARIEDVVTKVLAEAERQGLSAAIAEPVWRTLIDRCIAYEFSAFDVLKPGLDNS